MINELDIIPYKITEIQPDERVIVFAPHSDDETIGCGGTIALHAEIGTPVKIINLTDGSKADLSKKYNPQQYIKIRQNELKKAARILGVSDLEFWGYHGRTLHLTTELVDRCLDCFSRFHPTWIYAPGPTEIHPDHRTTANIVWDAVSQLDFPVKVSFYETLTPIRPNMLIDITAVIDKKKQALQAFSTQLAENHYERIIGLNEYRTLSLIDEKYKFAESFWTVDTTSDHYPSLAQLYLQQQQIDVLHKIKTGPKVSIIIRTKDRPHLLEEALQSVAVQTYTNLELIIVNDGGQSIDDVLKKFEPYLDIRLLNYDKNLGRAEAASKGLDYVMGDYIMFLDDDDLLYPEHCEILVDFLEHHDVKVAYTDTCCAFYERDEETGSYRLIEKKVIYSNDFNKSVILFENITPIMCIIFSREVLKRVTRLEDMLMYEDWNFWVRISRHYDFQHIRQVTSEYRIFTDRKGAYAHDHSPQRDYWLGYAFEKHRNLISGADYVEYQTQLKEKIASYESKIAEQHEQITALREHADVLEDFAIRVRKTLPFRVYHFFRNLLKKSK